MRVLALLLSLMLVGCSVKTPTLFKKDESYLEALRYTNMGDIAISLENKAQIIATYLNPFQKGEGERFFVRIYIDNDFSDPKKAGLHHPGFSLTLNGQKPLKIEELPYESELVKNMPFTQKWYHFYLVTFKKSTKDLLILTLSHPDFGSAELDFRNSDAKRVAH